MTMAGDLRIRDEGAMPAGQARQNKATTGSNTTSRRPAGPFGVVSPPGQASAARDTLITGLLIIYPAAATVAAIIVWLALTRGA